MNIWNKAPWAYVASGFLYCACAPGGDSEPLQVLKRLVESDPKPFVVIEATAKRFVGRGQGVLVSPRGYILSAGHVSWDDGGQRFVDTFSVKLRTSTDQAPGGAVHHHKTVFVDREGTTFHEHRYQATLLKPNGSRFIAGGDLCLFRLDTEDVFPSMEFFSKEKPDIEAGDVLHLCHYIWPGKDAEPTFLVNPVRVVGVAQTTSGTQYLAEGYCRWGSSGGAILKDGRLIGIQSAAYTINAKDIGEVPMGLLSFQAVWGSMFDGLLTPQDR